MSDLYNGGYLPDKPTSYESINICKDKSTLLIDNNLPCDCWGSLEKVKSWLNPE